MSFIAYFRKISLKYGIFKRKIERKKVGRKKVKRKKET